MFTPIGTFLGVGGVEMTVGAELDVKPGTLFNAFTHEIFQDPCGKAHGQTIQTGEASRPLLSPIAVIEEQVLLFCGPQNFNGGGPVMDTAQAPHAASRKRQADIGSHTTLGAMAQNARSDINVRLKIEAGDDAAGQAGGIVVNA